MARARFPGKPLRLQQRRRVALLARGPAPPPPEAPPAPPSRPAVRFQESVGVAEMRAVKAEPEKATAAAAAAAPTPAKKTVTFGAVESCDEFEPARRAPPKSHRPLVSIIKKKPAERSFRGIVKPAKLTDLGTKIGLDFGSLRARRDGSPPAGFSPPFDDAEFARPSRASKPSKRFVDGDAAKVLKRAKLVLSESNGDEAYETCDSSANSNDSAETESRRASVKPQSFFDRSLGLFGSGNVPSASFRDAFAGGVDASETPCTSDQSSGSGESETSDESPLSSDGDDSEAEEAAIERAQTVRPPSGKVVLREARLQLNGANSTSTVGTEGPFSTFNGSQNSTPALQPGTVTCGVCGAVRFYRFVKQARKFGVFSCESCRKFISKMIKRQNVAHASSLQSLQCVGGEGNCRVPPIVRSQQWKLLRCAYKARCHACWLKMCLNAFQVAAPLRTSLAAMLPAFMRAPAASNSIATILITSPIAGSSFSSTSNEKQDGVSAKSVKPEANEKIEKEDVSKLDKYKTKEEKEDSASNASRKRHHTRIKVRKKEKVTIEQQMESTKRQKVELKGPRVKHVCRSASIVLGQPLATFPTGDDKNSSDLSDDPSALEIDIPEEVKEDATDSCGECDSNKVIIVEDRPVPDESVVVVEESKETEIVKDEESSDSFDSADLKDYNKENDSSAAKAVPGVDAEKDDAECKTDVEQTVDVLPQRKSKQSFGNLTNLRTNSKQKYNQQRQNETICVDFWESYDPEEVCNTGWGLISTAPFTVSGVCFLCGSRGKEKLIYCMGCCEVYHPFCAEIGEESERMWLCPRCVQCGGCGRNGAGPASTICRACHRHFHADCLTANRTSKYRSDWPQMCSACLKCKSCDSFKVTKFLGNLPFCSRCFRLRQRGNYCPLCQSCYQDNDFDSKMMECGWCSRWVHARCEGLSGEGYQLVSALPHSVEYICKQCLPEIAPWRNMLGTYLRSKLLSVLKALAKNKNACTLLKLTPHKNTPISKKPCMCSSPAAVRKLQFEENSQNIDLSEKIKSDEGSPSDCEISGKNKGTVHKLQESMLQNKEICLTMGSCMSDDEPLGQLREKYHIKDCCVKMKDFSQSDDAMNSDDSMDTSDNLCRISNRNDCDKCFCCKSDVDISLSLLDIKTRVNCNEYSSVKDFNKDMLEVISRTLSPEIKQIYRDVFTETFPWFDCESNCLNPSLEIEDDNEEESLKDEDMSVYSISRNNDKILQKMNVVDDRTVPSVQSEFKSITDYSYEDESMCDIRMCVLCKIVGEGNPSMEERLLYCGQSDWIHANCALWSAEVFEEIDGSLQNVQSAIARGKMIKCSKCLNKGASVGCCAKNCSETYHFTCARNIGCALLDDKRVFCPSHVADAKDKALQKDNDFVLSRPVYVELDRKKKKYCEPQKVQFLLGSLSVKHLGKIVPSVSDFEDMLIPADFLCSRLYWSSKQPWKIVKYTIRTKLLVVEPSPAYDLGVNITLDHSVNPSTVERILAEIESWHKSLETDGHNLLLCSKKDKSPIKFGNANVSLEDYAVKQVMEYMLDIVCKHDQSEDTPEEEPQNTADLLPPELKDAIFEDLNHDLLDGISMQDIFPKFCYEDLVAMDLKSEVGFGNDVTKDKNSENTDDDKMKKGLIPNPENISQDFLEEFINSQNEPGKDPKKSKSELLLHSTSLKTLSNRSQRTCGLTWNYKLDNAFKRCKLPRSGILTRSDGSGNVVMIVDGTSDLVGNANSQKMKIEELSPDMKAQWQAKSLKEIEDGKDNSSNQTSPLFFKNDNESSNDSSLLKIDKPNTPSEQVIDFYTKMRCSPISQLDGADDSSCDSSSPGSPQSCDVKCSSIPQLDGADDPSSSSSSEGGSPPRDQTPGIFFRPNNMDNTYTMTISTANLNNLMPSNEILIRAPMEDNMIRPGHCEQTVKCDRCHCTYRTKDSFNRHLPTCDMMSTSESEGETPKSPESRTLTTLQNAFNNQFIAPTFINQQNQMFEASEQFNMSKPTLVSTRRTSINTRQITINGTIVETQSPGPHSPMKYNSDTSNSQEMPINIKPSIVHEAPKLTLGPTGILQPQIMVANLPITPPRNQIPNVSKCGIAPNQNNIPYSICVKPGSGLQTFQQQNPTIAHMLPNNGNIQTVFSSNPNQVLTISNPQQNIIQNIQGKGPQIMQAFANMPNGQTLAVPVNSFQGLPTNNGINTFVRPSLPIQNSSTILMSSANTPRIASPNVQQKNQILLPQVGQKSPKKLQQVQPKPIFQATRGRGRTINKTPTNKRQLKQDKPLTNINQITSNGTVIQFQPNGASNQPSIILQQVANPNMMQYVEAIQQQHGPNMQYIATIAPQGDYKPAPTHYITQGGMMPQTFQIQQTESGLVAVPSGGIPVFLPQGGVGILPQASLQSQGMTLSSQGNLQTQGVTPILPQGTIQTQNGATILPQATIQTQNGTIIPQGATIQTQNPTLLPANSIQSHNNSQNILPQGQNNIISQQPNTAIIPQGAILPQGLQFCNDQVLLGSTPTLEMVTDSSGCMYLTTQPVYYGLETIVQNTVMSSQQFVSTAMQGVLAQNSSFSATTTQVFQASKIEPMVEVPTGYVVVNNVPQDNIVVSQPNSNNSQTLISTQTLPSGNISVQSTGSIQKNKNGPNITIQPADKSHRSGNKPMPIQPNQPIFSISSPHQIGNTISLQAIQPRNIALAQGKQNINLQAIHSANISIPVNSSPHTTQCNQLSDGHVTHVSQPMMTNTITNKISSSQTQFGNQSLNMQESQSDMNGQNSMRTNFQRQCWPANQNFISTSSEGMTKNPSIIIQSSDTPNNNMSKVNVSNGIFNISTNSNNINIESIGNSRNFTSPFNQNVFISENMQTKNNQSVGHTNNNLQSTSCSFGTPVMHNSNNLTISSSNSMSSPYIFSGSLNQQMQPMSNNSTMMSNNVKDDSLQQNQPTLICDGSNVTTKQSNHHTPCSIHRQVSQQHDMMQNNSNNVVQLSGNVVNLGGKVYHIPMSSNSMSQASSIQNQINCNIQTNASMNNNNHEQIIGSVNNFNIVNGNCVNNHTSNLCSQHQIETANNQNQIMNVSNNQHQIQNQHQHVINSHSNLNNCNSISHMQIMNGANHQMQISNSNNHANMCNNRQPINSDHIGTIDNKGSNSEMSNMINDARVINSNERHMHVSNMNCVNRNSNINMMSNSNFIMHDNQQQHHCDMSSQFQINSDQMFLVNSNGSANQSNINNIPGRFQNVDNQQSSNTDHMNINNRINAKALQQVQKIESFNMKNVSNMNMTNIQADEASKMSMNKPNLPVSSGNQIGFIQMNSNSNQIIGFPENNRLPIGNAQFHNQRNQNTPMLTIGQGEIGDPIVNCNSIDISDASKNDMPSLSLSVNNPSVSSLSTNVVAKQIHLPHHNINFPMSNNSIQGYSNLQMNNNQINLAAQNVNNTISLPVQNSTSITLPKAPSHQTGIPTNVVNPIPQYMRPMNRVLPIHRDAQSNKANRPVKTKVEQPKPSPRCQDMPDLNVKEEEIVANDTEKAIRESKSIAEPKDETVAVVSENLEPVVVSVENKPDSIKILNDKTITLDSDNKAIQNALKENLTSNFKPVVQKVEQKISKENALILKTQNLNQRKIQMRSKIGSENMPITKATKQPSGMNRVMRDNGPKLIYEVSSEDGFSYTSTSLSELWNKVFEAVQASRKQHGLPLIKCSMSQNTSNAHILGLNNNALKYLIEQLPGSSRCLKYRAKQGSKIQSVWDSDLGVVESIRESPWGSVRAGPAIRKSSTDMFSWLASPYREPPPPLTISQDDSVISRRISSVTLPMAMRFRNLKETSKHSVGVYRSRIHGRGLFCRRDIEAGEMVIEYAGEVIRAALADQRERRYEAARGGRGVTGCYMFRVDDHLVVDATMKGNAARFINHSCDPNCYSKVVDILGHKHILILALRRIYQGEELTYDYKFPFEEVKIPCSCGAKKCRKYLN